MDQAAVDLPDPLGAGLPRRAGAATATAAAGADDLLSQLAGDEIDRLLADADVERDSAAGGPRGTAAPTTPPDETFAPAAAATTTADPDADLLPDALADEPAAGPVPAAAAGGDDPALTAQLDQLFDQLTDADAPAVPPAAAAASRPPTTTAATAESEAIEHDDPPPEDPPAPPAGPPAEAPAKPSDDPAMAVKLDDLFAELAADDVAKEAELRPPPAGPATSGAPAAAAEWPAEAGPSADADEETAGRATADDEADADPVPPAPRWLGWLEAPLAGRPDWVRDAIGKAAILTFLNAIAVLIYVLFFYR